MGQEIALAGATVDPAIQESPAPAALTAQTQPGGVRLTWRSPAKQADGIEVQRLQPTYVGPRFEPIATVAGNLTSFVDDAPLPGEQTVYRVRASFGDRASAYSNHVRLTAPAKSVALESQAFDKPPTDLRDEFRQPAADVDVEVIADPSNPGNRVLHIRARRPSGSAQFRVRPRWTASQRLFDALNASVGRARGSRPDIYRMQFEVRFLQARVSPGSEVSMQVDPGFDLFSTPGRRQDLIALAGAHADGAQSSFKRVSFDFAALPNGDGARGLQQYRALAPTILNVAFPIDLRGEGDVVEFLLDNLTISRLDAP